MCWKVGALSKVGLFGLGLSRGWPETYVQKDKSYIKWFFWFFVRFAWINMQQAINEQKKLVFAMYAIGLYTKHTEHISLTAIISKKTWIFVQIQIHHFVNLSSKLQYFVLLDSGVLHMVYIMWRIILLESAKWF